MTLRCLIAVSILSSLPLHAQETGSWQQGITEPIFDATLSSSVIGVIAKVNTQEGEMVREGQVIFELNRRHQELEVRRREIERDSKRKDYERTKRLFERTSSISQEELDLKEAAMNLAQTEWELAKADLDERFIRAPFTGVVTDLFALTIGEGVEIGTQVARLVDTSRFVFVASVPKTVADGFVKAQSVQIEIGESNTITTATGAISFISSVADPSSGLTKIKAICDNSARKIRPGMPARLRLAPDTTAAANAR